MVLTNADGKQRGLLRESADGVEFLQIHRPDTRNALDRTLLEEFEHALETLDGDTRVVVIQGLPDVFCFGMDFASVVKSEMSKSEALSVAELLYSVWERLAVGPFVSVAVVEGAANAGGVGFVACCDIVLAGPRATFSLSELLFGLYPACVLPFLNKRIGAQKANYMTLMTTPIDVRSAHGWGLVDAFSDDPADLLRKHLLRLRLLSRENVERYKRYSNGLPPSSSEAKGMAVSENARMFSDPRRLELIRKFITTGSFPWEG